MIKSGLVFFHYHWRFYSNLSYCTWNALLEIWEIMWFRLALVVFWSWQESDCSTVPTCPTWSQLPGLHCWNSLDWDLWYVSGLFHLHGNSLNHWSRLMHKCVSDLTIIGSDNGLLPGRCQAIIWTNAGILLIGLLGANFSEILIEIHTFSFKKMHLKWSSAKSWPFCPDLNVSTFLS